MAVLVVVHALVDGRIWQRTTSLFRETGVLVPNAIRRVLDGAGVELIGEHQLESALTTILPAIGLVFLLLALRRRT